MILKNVDGLVVNIDGISKHSLVIVNQIMLMYIS